MAFERFAPAKVNLFLHVGSREPDGYHPICSLMVFANVGDTVALHKNGAAGLAVDGPFAADLADETGNLVLRARDALLSAAGSVRVDFGLRLHKALPIAAGLGGGSSDAAAAMHLVRTRLSFWRGRHRHRTGRAPRQRAMFPGAGRRSGPSRRPLADGRSVPRLRSGGRFRGRERADLAGALVESRRSRRVSDRLPQRSRAARPPPAAGDWRGSRRAEG